MQKNLLSQLFNFFIFFALTPVAIASTNEQQYYIKLGSFSNPENANRLQANLTEQYHLPISISTKGSYTVVNAGPYTSKEQALDIQKQYKLPSNNAIVTVAAETSTKERVNNTTEKTTKIKGSQSTESFSSPPPEQSKRLWNLRQANIRSVIQAVSKITGKNFLIDPRVQGKVSIVSSKAVGADELYPIFLSMLQVSGFAAIPSGDVIKIVPNIDARSIGGFPSSDEAHPAGDDMIVQVVAVKYVSAEQLVPVIRPLMPQWSNVSAYGPSNMLILSGRADNIQRLASIINQVDSSSSNGIDIVSLRYALAMDVVATVKALTDNQKTRGYQQTATIAADDKSNTILLSGPKAERLRVRLIIDQLDKKSSANNANTEVIYLRYLKAQDILPILSGVAKANFSGSVGTTVGTITTTPLDTSTPSTAGSDSSSSSSSSTSQDASSSSNNSAIATNTQASSDSSEGNSKPKVQLIADPNTNSIILSAPQTLMRTFKTIIAKLDTRPAQILVEALITEIDESDVSRLGLEWGMLTPGTGTNSASFSPGFAIISSTMQLKDFQAQLTALVTSQKANILSTPSVVVLDNRQAKILVGKEISIQDSSYPGNSGGGGQLNPYNTFTRKNVALHLYVRPQISQGNSIQLQIDHGNDTLPNDETATNGRPVVNKSSIQTSVLVNSGDVLVLGGLVQHGRQLAGTKLPILGDIPGVGQLFQKNAHGKAKKVLMVFIRPIIMKNNRTDLQVSGSKYFDLRQQQLEWMRDYQPYDPQNKEMIMPSVTRSARLAKPFSTPYSKNS